MATIKSTARGTAIKVTLPTGDEFLLVEIAVDCPSCGQYTIRLAGHHLRMVRDLLIEMIDLHPHLTGKDDDLTVLEKLHVPIAPPGDPTLN